MLVVRHQNSTCKGVYKNINAVITSRPRQDGRHFRDDILKCIFFNEGSNQQYSIIGSDNGLAPTRRQAIIWANDG